MKVGIPCVFTEGAKSLDKRLSFSECVEMLWNTDLSGKHLLVQSIKVRS